MEEHCLLAWFPLLVYSDFLELWGSADQGWHCPKWAEPSHINHPSKRCPRSQCPGGNFLNWGSLFHNDSSLLCQADIKCFSQHLSCHCLEFENVDESIVLGVLFPDGQIDSLLHCFHYPSFHSPGFLQVSPGQRTPTPDLHEIMLDLVLSDFCFILLDLENSKKKLIEN